VVVEAEAEGKQEKSRVSLFRNVKRSSASLTTLVSI
jgi:hypothetical protein